MEKMIGITHCKMCLRKMAVIGGHKGRGMGPTCLNRYLSDLNSAYAEQLVRLNGAFQRRQALIFQQAGEERQRRRAQFIAEARRRQEVLQAVAMPYQFQLLPT